ncbi:similar to Saccharomyces cerevisiae YGL220W FRA2 Protein involved in negative regulation of transcription of iron regulon [Geotrichum candidum]|uniref:Similar to Saccharomyces cerevisiae YGL220W FRA2 Protein involved in negative regulation of transcription of iron regulon n=1 Tax=Geotrichum candidum TaxID=1173061 RepID=A0A0J9XFZ9_GEOCN|nr:similar to Saccharomyces cerevisiae YGL220W FRA2 Protein involved in negative regulation of transcription of iron regulon [Geotrichum candidum]
MSEGISIEYLDQTIRHRLEATHVEIIDTSGGCGQAFEVVIVSNIFLGKNKLLRHRMVNRALRDEIMSIHAFTQKDYTPEEWARLTQHF